MFDGISELWAGTIVLTLGGFALWGWWFQQRRQIEQAKRRQEMARNEEHARFAAAWMLALETNNRLGRDWRKIECSPPDEDGNIHWHLRAGLHEKVVVANGYFQPRFGYICLTGYNDEESGRWIKTYNCTRTYSHHTPAVTAMVVFSTVLEHIGLPTTPDQVELGDETTERGLACIRMGTATDGDEHAGTRLGFGYVLGSEHEGIIRIHLGFGVDGTKLVGIGTPTPSRGYCYRIEQNGRIQLTPLPQD